MSSMRVRARPGAGTVRSLGSVAVACNNRSDPDVDEQEGQRAAGLQARRRLPPPTCRLVALALAASVAIALLAALLLGTELDGWRQQQEANRHPAMAAPPPTAADQPGGAVGQAAPVDPESPESRHAAAVEDAQRLVQQMQQHVAQHGPAGSFWPAGCRWREQSNLAPLTGGCDPATVPQLGKAFGGFEAVWRCHGYEWWDEAQQAWTPEQPAACRLQAVGADEWAAAMAQLRNGHASGLVHGPCISTWALQEAQQPDGNATAAAAVPAGTSNRPARVSRPAPLGADFGTQVRCAQAYCVFKNLFYRGGRFYFVQHPGSPTKLAFPWQLGRSRQGATISVADAAQFAASVRARVVAGETAVLDWVFFMHPTALGHWLEMLMPLFSYLRHEPLVRRTPDRVLMLFQQRANINDWVRGVLAAALGVMPGQPLPPLLFEREVATPTQQPQQLLEGAEPDEWLVFDQVLWPRDMFHGGNRGCRDGTDARLMRALLHAMHGTRLPPAGAAPPATITLQRKSANRRIVNEEEVVDMLREFGEVRVVEFDSSSSLREQLELAAGTGLFVSVHTSNLANALWLPPGAAVVEILQRNWAWEDIDQFFVSLTKQLEDVHHFALRAQGLNETLHTDPRLARLFGNWSASQCQDQCCVESLTHASWVDIRVDVPRLRQLIAGRLALIRSGASVAEAALPWPHLQGPAEPPKQAPAAQPQPQQRRQVRLAARLFDTGLPEVMPDVADVWAYVRHL